MNINKLTTIGYLVISVICCGLVIEFWVNLKDNFKKNIECTPEVDSVVVKEDWKSIETLDFDLDMEKMGVVLVKRSFNKGDEVTLIELADGKSRYFICSREIHSKLVDQFRQLRLKKAGGF